VTRRYAFVGLGHRAQMYVDALLGDWSDAGEIVALCDVNQTRMDYYNDRITASGRPAVPCYAAEDFGSMLERADAVVVATVDATHADYVCAALDAGRDVIVEKPLTTGPEGCARIAAAAERSSAQLIVTFNYRYSPRNSIVRQLISEGRVGDVKIPANHISFDLFKHRFQAETGQQLDVTSACQSRLRQKNDEREFCQCNSRRHFHGTPPLQDTYATNAPGPDGLYGDPLFMTRDRLLYFLEDVVDERLRRHCAHGKRARIALLLERDHDCAKRFFTAFNN
jgi:hypothetical protein